MNLSFLKHVHCAGPVAKRNGDIQWRILHGAFASCRRSRQMGYCETNKCPFEMPVDILHIFVICSRLRELTLYLMSLLKCFNPSMLLTLHLWLYGDVRGLGWYLNTAYQNAQMVK